MIEFFIALVGGAYIAGKCISENRRIAKENQYYAQQGFNLERQRQLERMRSSADPEERKEFNRILGRTMRRGDGGWDAILAVRQISLREGWTFHTFQELCLAYTGPENAARMNAETDRRKVWISRCPHGEDVDIFPMDFETEEQYQNEVKRLYYSWRNSCKKNTFGINPEDYDTESEYDDAVNAMKSVKI